MPIISANQPGLRVAASAFCFKLIAGESLRIRNFFLLAFVSMTILGAEPASHRKFSIELDSSADSPVRTFNDPAFVVQIEAWYRFTGKFPKFVDGEGGGILSAGMDAKKVEFSIEQDGVSADTLTVYLYRPGCRVGYYQVDDLKNGSLIRKFNCEPAADKLIKATIQNFKALSLGDTLLASVHYGGVRSRETIYGISYETVDFTAGHFPISKDGTFTLALPDFGNDPNLSQTLPQGSFEVSLYRMRTQRLGALFLPYEEGARRKGPGSPPNGQLRVAGDYPSDLQFAFDAER